MSCIETGIFALSFVMEEYLYLYMKNLSSLMIGTVQNSLLYLL